MSQAGLLLLIIGLSLATAAWYLMGARRMRARARSYAVELEQALQALEQQYTNIGGLVGYHGQYRARPPFPEIKVTFTLLPRHSLLFLPAALLISRHDRLYLTLYCDRPLPGEGHWMRRRLQYHPLHRVADQEGLQVREELREGCAWIRYQENEAAAAFVDACRDELDGSLVHHCSCYPANRVCYLYMKPVPGKVAPLVGAFVAIAARMAEERGQRKK